VRATACLATTSDLILGGNDQSRGMFFLNLLGRLG
jgi:hypothetical protein